jgi:hypothetical protein
VVLFIQLKSDERAVENIVREIIYLKNYKNIDNNKTNGIHCSFSEQNGKCLLCMLAWKKSSLELTELELLSQFHFLAIFSLLIIFFLKEQGNEIENEFTNIV